MRTLLLFLLLCFAKQASAQCNPVITTSGPTTFCSGGSVTLTGSLGDTYQWYKDGNLILNAINSTYNANASGSYTVEIDSVGCVNMSPAVVVTVNTVPAQPGFITGDGVLCAGSTGSYSIDPVPGATSYYWHAFSQGSQTATTIAPSTTLLVASSYNYSSPDCYITVKAINVCGQSPVSEKLIAVYVPRVVNGFNNDPDFTYGGEATTCPYSQGVLNAYSSDNPAGVTGPITSFQWYRNGTPIPGAVNYQYAISRGGSYMVAIGSANVCVANYTKNFIHQPVPMPIIEALTPLPICDGGVALLKVNFDMDGFDGLPDYTWKWVYNGTSVTSYDNQVYYMATSSGDYSIYLQGHMAVNGWVTQCNSIPTLINVTGSSNQATPISVTQSGMTLSATPGFASYQWYRNWEPIPGATNADHTMLIWGSYFVLGTDNNGCVSQSNITLDVNKTESRSEQVRVYPNPNTGAFILYASIASDDKTATVSISDISGRLVMDKQVAIKNGEIEERINMDEQLPSGMYFLKLSSGGFNKVVSFVKQ